MATVFSHVVVAGALTTVLPSPRRSPRVWAVAALCSVLPDLDVVGFAMGIPYAHPLGHRGWSHSLSFAALLATAVIPACFRGPRWRPAWAKLWLLVFVVTASHGLLDAMTNGGLGIAFFAPFDNTRYFLPFRPIEVSPITIRLFFALGGWRILLNEALWLWIPSGLIAALAVLLRKRTAKSAHPA